MEEASLFIETLEDYNVDEHWFRSKTID
jgi:hypothetical protein